MPGSDISDNDQPSRVTGHVKWFDSGRGYGFVTSPDVSRDILIHANILRNFGQSSVSDGSIVTVKILETERGIQAEEIYEIKPPPESRVGEGGTGEGVHEGLIGGPLEPARIKWFDRAKGFGFANVFGKPDDVFIHIEVLRRSALADLQPGEAVVLRVAEGERGRLATQVSTWESALTTSSQD